MTRIVIETRIYAPIELCFDLARDVNAHRESAAFSSERVVPPGRTEGLLELGDLVAFEGDGGAGARSPPALDRPRRFDDQMVQGSFKWLRHFHEFESANGITTMRDTLEWEPPLGLVGRLADRLFLRRHMHWFVSTKQNGLKRMAEAQANTLLDT